MKSSFKDFVIEHLWLFVVCILFPVVVIDLFCYFNNYDLEQGTAATIVIGVLTYIGTILWGMFIYYKSWLDKKMQEYRDRPIVKMNVDLSNKVHLEYKMYDKSEVDEILGYNIEIHGLKQTQNKGVKYVLITIANYGTSILSDISIQNIVFKNDKELKEQGSYGYICKNKPPKALMFGEKWELFVAIDEVLFYELEEGYKTIVITIKFNHNITDIYYGIIELNTTGIGSYGQSAHLYSENEFIGLERVKSIEQNNRKKCR